MSRFRANRTKSSGFISFVSHQPSRARDTSQPARREKRRSIVGTISPSRVSRDGERGGGPREKLGPRSHPREDLRGSEPTTIAPFLAFCRSRADESARIKRKTAVERKRQNGNLWARLFRATCPPSWSRLTTGVDQRNFAISLLPSPFLPIYLPIYLSLCLSLSFILSLSLPVFLHARFVPLALSLLSPLLVLLCLRTP